MWPSCGSANEPAKGLHQFSGHLLPARRVFGAGGHAVLDVALGELDRDLVQRRGNGGDLLQDVRAPAMDALCATGLPEPGSPIASVEVRHLEGALARRSATAGALASLDARFAVYAVGMAGTPELAPLVAGAIDLLLDALAPWDAGRRYPNFAERRADASGFYPAETTARLRRIRAAYDPDELIRSAHPIKPQP
jgi:hypothetical protein